jgi:predicted CXXCH cytochrome family protein
MMQCVSCHEKALESTQTKDVLLPKSLDVCAKCHNAEGRGNATARSDCIECHRYHPHERVDPEHPRPLSDVLGK